LLQGKGRKTMTRKLYLALAAVLFVELCAIFGDGLKDQAAAWA
jgi:hypothetical protein